MNWSTKEIDKGNHPENKDIVFNFKYVGDKKIVKATGSCGCTHVEYTDNTVSGYVKPKKIDEIVPAIVQKREYNNEQNIVVTFNDSTTDVLKVKAKIVSV